MYKATQRFRTLLLACFTVIISVFLAVAMWVAPTTSYTASAAEVKLAATFTLGTDGSASHADGSSKTSYTETNNGYTLNITSGTNMYTGARDAKGNSCIKFGASSKAGSCSIGVPDDIEKVVLYIAKYKANTTNIKVNNTSYTISSASDNGAYDTIEVDTSSTKTVTLTTVSGGYRAMLNTIEFYVASTSSCEHANTTTTTVDATCTTEGSTTITCDDCGEEISKETFPATGHLNTTEVETQAPSCTVAGSKSVTCGDCSTSWNEEIPATGHNYIDGVCKTCGASEPNEKEESLEIYSTTGTLTPNKEQISWSSGNISFTNKKGSSSTAIRTSDSDHLRVYVGNTTVISTNNYAKITKIVISCVSGYIPEQDTLNNTSFTASVNGTSVTIIPTEPSDSITISTTKQWRLNKVTVTYEQDASVAECTHNYEAEVTAPTCTENGFTTHTCSLCGDSYIDTETDKTGHNDELTNSVAPNCTTPGAITYTCNTCGTETTETIPLLGHNYANGTCTNCDGKMPTKATLTFDDPAKRTELSNEIQVWKESGIVLTNNKASSTTPVADYAKPARFYKNSELVVTFPDMLKIEFVCNNNSYATDLADSIASATQNNNIVTVLFTEMTNSFTVTLVAAIRIDSITVHTAKIDSASITLGDDITMNYYVMMPQGAEIHLTVNDEAQDVKVELQQDGRYKFSLPIPPQFMAANISAELKLGDMVLASMTEYSVKQYAQNKLNAADSSNELKQLITDLLYYGDAAYNYANNTTGETPATSGIENLGTVSTATPDTTDFTLVKNSEISSYPAYFTGASVYFDSVNKLCIKINTTENVTLTINGEDVAVNSTVIYVENLGPLSFDTTYTFVLSCNDVVMQTLTYSVNAYAYAMKDNETMSELALALYRYGVSAENFKNPQQGE